MACKLEENNNIYVDNISNRMSQSSMQTSSMFLGLCSLVNSGRGDTFHDTFLDTKNILGQSRDLTMSLFIFPLMLERTQYSFENICSGLLYIPDNVII